MKKYTIILFYLFILIDNFSLNIIKGIRERTYSVYIEYPYLIYEILKLIILGILLGLYFYNGSIKKIYLYLLLFLNTIIIFVSIYYPIKYFKSGRELLFIISGIFIFQIFTKIKNNK